MAIVAPPAVRWEGEFTENSEGKPSHGIAGPTDSVDPVTQKQ